MSSLLYPPEMLRMLEMGESLILPSTPIEITRVATVPDIFVFRKFLPCIEDRHALIEEAFAIGMEDAETKAGKVLHRKNSSVVWIRAGEEDSSNGELVAEFMTGFVPKIFLNEQLVDSGQFEAETLQVARYTNGGKYDLHHDGFGRIVTILTYLNGIAGTWFPFAKFSRITAADNMEFPPEMILEGTGMTVEKIPGQDGLWIVGDEYEAETPMDSNTVKVNAGDAIVFYNYDYDQDCGGPIMAWRSIHAGMKTTHEKWIATNWINSDLVAKTK